MNRNVLIALIGNVAPPLSAFASAPLLARALGVDGRGEAAAATAPLLLLLAALTLGLPESITFHIARQRLAAGKQYIATLGALASLGAVGAAATWLGSGFLAAGNSELAATTSLMTLALVPALVVGGLRGAALGAGLWWQVTCEKVTSSAARLAGTVVLFTSGALTPTTAAAAVAGATFVGGAVYLFGQRRVGFAQRGSAARTASVFSYGGRVWFGAIAGILLMRMDQLLLTPLSGVAALGIYAVAVNVSEVILVFNTAVRDVVFTQGAKEGDVAKVRSAIRISSAITLAVGIMVGALIPWAVPWLFGQDFTEAVPVALILVMAVVLGNPGSIAGAGLSAFAHPGLRSAAISAGFIVNLIALVPLAVTWGALGAAFATLLGNVASGGGSLILFSRVTSSRLRDVFTWTVDDRDSLRRLAAGILPRRK